MRSFDAQIQHIRQKKAEVLLTDIAAQEMMTDAMERYLRGARNDRQIRFDLENVIRGAYRTSARAAMSAARWQAGLGRRWSPVDKKIVTPTLERLLEDVRRNLRVFKETEQEPTDVRKAILRFRLSATAAAQMGFSDGQRISFVAIRDSGTQVRKFWGANFSDGNQPCPHCINLHGVEAGLDEEFPTYGRVKTYGALYGPPLHPRCRCDALYVVVENGNRDDRVDLGEPVMPKMFESTKIRDMPGAVFRAIIGALSRALDLLRKAAGL